LIHHLRLTWYCSWRADRIRLTIGRHLGRSKIVMKSPFLRRRPADRRRSPRHSPASEGVRLGWQVGRVFRDVPGQLRDLAGRGASVAVEGPAPSTGPVWLFHDAAPDAGWLRTDLVATATEPDGTTLVRLRFVDLCPTSVFRAALGGEVEPEGLITGIPAAE
jgi:hypothetical protein